MFPQATRALVACAVAIVGSGCSPNRAHRALERDLTESSLAAAHASQRLGETGRSQELLGLTPPSERNWVWQHLNAVSDDSDDAWDAHAGTVYALAFNPDGTRLLSGSSTGEVRLWNPSTHEMLREFKGHTHEIHDVTFTPDGKTGASSSTDATVRLWDLESGAERLVYKGHDTPVGGIIFAPDGRTAVSSSYIKLKEPPYVEGMVKFWDPETGEDIAEIRGLGKKPISCLAMTRDGALVAAGTWDFDIRIIDVATRREIRRIESEDFGVYRAIDSVDFSPDGTYIAAASRDRRARVWRVADGSPVATLGPLDGSATFVSFSPDGEQLSVASEDGTAQLYSTRDWSQLAALRGHRLGIRPLAWSQDSATLLTGSADGTIRSWNTRGVPFGRQLLRDLDGLGVVEYSPDDRKFVTCSFDGVVSVWDAATNQCVARWFAHRDGTCNTATFSPDGLRIATCSWNRELFVWDAVTGEKLRALTLERGVSWPEFSPDGRRLAASHGGKIDVWDLESGEQVWSIEASKGAIGAIDWSRDGKYIATAPHALTVGVHDAETGAQVLALPGHAGGVISSEFSPDSRTLATLGGFGVLRIWSIPDGKLIATSAPDPSGGNRIAFSPDGALIATGSARAQVFDARDLRRLLTLHEHPSALWSLGWSHDGTRLATSSMDGTLVISDSRPRRDRGAGLDAARESNTRMKARVESEFAAGKSARAIVDAIATDGSLSDFDRGSAELAIIAHMAPPRAAEAELASQKKP